MIYIKPFKEHDGGDRIPKAGTGDHKNIKGKMRSGPPLAIHLSASILPARKFCIFKRFICFRKFFWKWGFVPVLSK